MISPERQSARPTIASICGVIAAVRRFRGSIVASARPRAHVPAAASIAAVADAHAPRPFRPRRSRCRSRGGRVAPRLRAPVAAQSERDHSGASMTRARTRRHGARMLDAPQRRISVRAEIVCAHLLVGELRVVLVRQVA